MAHGIARDLLRNERLGIAQAAERVGYALASTSAPRARAENQWRRAERIQRAGAATRDLR